MDIGVSVRPRLEADLDDCARVARQVKDQDGYPPYLPGDDLRRFLAGGEALAAWVACTDGMVAGHVALHRRSSPEVMDLAVRAVGLPADRLGVVARLLVDPTRRRSGIGRLLLRTAVAEARERHLQPVLDVVHRFGSAIGLYEAEGWVRLGSVKVRLDIPAEIEEYVYALPPS